MFSRPIRLVGSLVLAAALVGCDDPLPGPDPDFLTVTPSSANVEPGDVQQLTATIGDDPVAVTWESENNAIATVNASGLVSTVSSGVTAITATLTSDPNIKRSATINVLTLQGTALTKGTPVTINTGTTARGSGPVYRLFVPAGSTSLSFTLTGGTGDGDICVRRGTPATYSTASGCVAPAVGPWEVGNEEVVTIANPDKGSWYVTVFVWDPVAGATLTGTYTP